MAKTTSLHTRVAGTEELFAEAEIILASLTLYKQMTFSVTFTHDGNAYTVSGMNTGAGQAWADGCTLRLRTPRFTLPGAVTALNVNVEARCSGVGALTIDVGQWSLNIVPAA